MQKAKTKFFVSCTTTPRIILFLSKGCVCYVISTAYMYFPPLCVPPQMLKIYYFIMSRSMQIGTLAHTKVYPAQCLYRSRPGHR